MKNKKKLFSKNWIFSDTHCCTAAQGDSRNVRNRTSWFVTWNSNYPDQFVIWDLVPNHWNTSRSSGWLKSGWQRKKFNSKIEGLRRKSGCLKLISQSNPETRSFIKTKISLAGSALTVRANVVMTESTSTSSLHCILTSHPSPASKAVSMLIRLCSTSSSHCARLRRLPVSYLTHIT